MNNHSSYEEETSDTTTWEHAWGLELSAEIKFEENLYFEASEFTVGGTASYNGKYGTSNTVSDKITVQESATVTCPPRTKCKLYLKAKHLNNQGVPYTATVRKTVGSDITEYPTTGN